MADVLPTAAWDLGVSEWTLRAESPAHALQEIALAGFTCVEMAFGARTDTGAGVQAVASTGLGVTSVCTLFGADADFAAPDRQRNVAAATLLRSSVDYAQQLGAATVIVVPSDTPQPHAGARHDQLQRAADGIAAVAQIIPAGGPQLVIEPLNRDETHLVTTLHQAAELAAFIDSPAVGVMADLYHMHRSEQHPLAALQRHAGRLRHVHLAETDRRAPGSGHLDFAAVVTVLTDVGYRGALVVECLPADVRSLTGARVALTDLLAGVT